MENEESLLAPDLVTRQTSSDPVDTILTLGELPVGARLVLRCRKDWRDATVVATTFETTVLSVGSPSGRTYRLRRPSNSLLSIKNCIPILGEGIWQLSMVRYDIRW